MGIFAKRRSPESMKRLYNWFHRYYRNIERSIGPMLDTVLEEQIRPLGNLSRLSAADYACGTGMLTLRIAPLFEQVTGYDQSEGMLSRAREAAQNAGFSVEFIEGNLLDIQLPENSEDWIFVSFALHLFPMKTEIEILKNLLRVARVGVMIIDHPRKRTFGTALVERLEGSWYDQFIQTDFEPIARQLGAAFHETESGGCMVLTFRKEAS